MKLRQWQTDCIQKALAHYKTNKNFLCLASPGAGKTILSAALAKILHEEHKIDLIVCLSPSAEIARKSQKTFEKILSRRLDGTLGSIGVSLTYQKLGFITDDFWELFNQHRVFVILDEIHHLAGNITAIANTWGEQVLSNIKDKAAAVLMMSGTPWRSDSLPITLAQYDNQKEIVCNYVYGLRNAVADGVCCVPKIELVDNNQIIVKSAGKKSTYQNFSSLFCSRNYSYSKLIQNSILIKQMLNMSYSKLQDLRKIEPSYGGLVVAANIEHANNILDMLINDMGCSAVLVHSGQSDAAQTIDQFRRSTTEWIVSVGMISEGTDIPRLKVCCYLSDVKTEMYFRQVLGRIIRVTTNVAESAWLYMLNQSTLRKYAEQVQQDLPQYRIVSFESQTNQIDTVIDGSKKRTIGNAPEFSIEIEESNFQKIQIIGAYTSKLVDLFLF